jgi:hypothetical protein
MEVRVGASVSPDTIEFRNPAREFVGVIKNLGPSAAATPPPPIDRRRLADMAPVMPEGFYGSVLFSYQDGRLVMTEVREKVRP